MTEPLTPAQTISFLLSVVASGERLSKAEAEAARAVARDAARQSDDRLREALKPFVQAASLYASLTHVKDNYIVGPRGLTAADWRMLYAALASHPEEKA